VHTDIVEADMNLLIHDLATAIEREAGAAGSAGDDGSDLGSPAVSFVRPRPGRFWQVAAEDLDVREADTRHPKRH
jgi:hypothetical protein